MPTTWSADTDRRLREQAMDWLSLRSHDGADALTTDEIKEFRFHGDPLPPMDLQRGIRKPADGLIRYKYRGTDPDHPENRTLRVAMNRRLPLIC